MFHNLTKRTKSGSTKCWVAAAAIALIAAPALADQPKDGYITSKVKIELFTADTSSPLGINVDTQDGIVTLSGRVDSDVSKHEAEQAALSVKGVRDVRNMLAVVPDAHEKLVSASDEQLEQRIATVLERDRALEKSDIHVESVHGGNVILGGKADTLAAHQRALEDARSVDGVRRVASEIESSNANDYADEQIRSEAAPRSVTGSASDAWITTKVKLRLIRKPGIAPLAINVDTSDGIVTLFGSVSTADGKRMAGEQAMLVGGVKDVQNELQVVPKTAVNSVEKRDDQIRDSVQEQLEGRKALGDDNIDIEVANGVVRLSGSVDHSGDRLIALSAARSTQGVRSVVDGLRVEHRG